MSEALSEPESLENLDPDLRKRLERDWGPGWNPPSESPPGLLYHYTDAVGFHGIIQDGAIWATHSGFLNDIMELRAGDIVVRTVLDGLMQMNLKGGQARFVESFRGAYSHLGSKYPAAAFVASFSGEADLLSQWRAYGGESGGYALGFRLDGVAGLARCRYDLDETMEEAIRDLERLAVAFEQTEAIVSPDQRKDILSLFETFAWRRMGLLAARHKHSAFSEEKEWRLFLHAPVGGMAHMAVERLPRFRPSRQGLVPYQRIPLAHLLAEVVVWPPIAGPRLGCDAAKAFLLSKGHSNVAVTCSEVPLKAR